MKSRFKLVLCIVLLACALEASWRLYDGKRAKVVYARDVPAFVIPPDGDGPYLRFLAVGDTGTGEWGQQRVADAMAEHVREQGADLVVTLGDNFYEPIDGIDDPDWKTCFEDVYADEALQIPFYPSLGNHDLDGTDGRHQIAYSAHSERWSMPAPYYTFTEEVEEGCSVQFFALETVSLHVDVESETSREQLAWLEEELARSTAHWKVVYGHHPIESTGKHGSSIPLRMRLAPILLEHDVDLYLAGHDHHVAIMRPVEGLTMVISGAGGRHPRDVAWSEEVEYAQAGLGFTWFRVGRDELVIEAVDAGAEVRYAKVIEKPFGS